MNITNIVEKETDSKVQILI